MFVEQESALDRTPPRGHDPSLPPLPPLPSPLFHGKSQSTDLEFKQAPPMTPQPCSTCHLLQSFWGGGQRGGGARSISSFLLFFLNMTTPSPRLITDLLRFLKCSTKTRAAGLELVPLLPQLEPHIDPCERSLTRLSFRRRHRDLVMTRERSLVNLGQGVELRPTW